MLLCLACNQISTFVPEPNRYHDTKGDLTDHQQHSQVVVSATHDLQVWLVVRAEARLAFLEYTF